MSRTARASRPVGCERDASDFRRLGHHDRLRIPGLPVHRHRRMVRTRGLVDHRRQESIGIGPRPPIIEVPYVFAVANLRPRQRCPLLCIELHRARSHARRTRRVECFRYSRRGLTRRLCARARRRRAWIRRRCARVSPSACLGLVVGVLGSRRRAWMLVVGVLGSAVGALVRGTPLGKPSLANPPILPSPQPTSRPASTPNIRSRIIRLPSVICLHLKGVEGSDRETLFYNLIQLKGLIPGNTAYSSDQRSAHGRISRAAATPLGQ